MFEIRVLKNQNGAALLNTLLGVFMLGLMAISMATLVYSDKRMQTYNIQERRAFYAAQSGIEYAMRGAMEYAANNSSVTSLDNYTESVNVGNGQTCQISINTIGTDSIEITASGVNSGTSVTLMKGFNYIDVASYAIYAGGPVTDMKTSPSNNIMQNATHMPLFDDDVLVNMAMPDHYFIGNLTVTAAFIFNQSFSYVTGNTTFNSFLWTNSGNWVSGGNIDVNAFLSLSQGTFYQPNPGVTCDVPLGFLFRGGLISAGSIDGSTWWFLGSTVFRDRTRINNLMQNSVNGGPLVIRSSNWTREN